MHFHSLIEIDKTTRNLLLKWLYNNVHNSDNPRLHGKALQGELSDLWRYRVGKYRIIVEIQDDELVVLAIDIGIRGSIYKRK
ncbi:type II toxin-antitoxin system RelE family toxin [Staphylococcus agnetis]|uniref:type II toxin-antitoxin system RelE family toxin n=1 Tax=Staphylococcus agnetis TaxID=985762 RepID=UPI001FD7C34C|nr:type II toxin-antitoxin system RelE/ParE family toxin [Staphylococcus agnetis]